MMLTIGGALRTKSNRSAQLLCVRVSLLWYRAPRTKQRHSTTAKASMHRLIVQHGSARFDSNSCC
eukprot:7185-Heterococcus_DN1.PRE.2